MSRDLRRVAAADAGWDAVVGVALCLSPWVISSWFGLRPGEYWLLFVALGLACFAFSVVLVRAARGHGTREICRAAAIANAVAVPAVVIVLLVVPQLQLPARIAFVVIAVVCAAFAVAEWRSSETGASGARTSNARPDPSGAS